MIRSNTVKKHNKQLLSEDTTNIWIDSIRKSVDQYVINKFIEKFGAKNKSL